MALTACEISWLSSLLKDTGLCNLPPNVLKVDNQAALSTAANPVLHRRTKHIELDCHYVRDKIVAGEITTGYVPSHAQVVDILTKPLSVKQHYYLFDKFGFSAQHSTPLEGE